MAVTPEAEPLLLDAGAKAQGQGDPGQGWWPDPRAQGQRNGYGSVANKDAVNVPVGSVGDGAAAGGGGGEGEDGRMRQTPCNPVTYTWTSLNVFAPGPRPPRTRLSHWFCRRPPTSRVHLLKNVSGVALPGEMLAILGASGAGKTTLLDALTFRSDRQLAVSGARALSGAVVTSSHDLAGLAAYVQQADLFVGWLTVREHLVFQALLRMDRRIPRRQRMQRVREVMDELGLQKCQDTIIGVPGKVKGISGGEMKRLSFASEVLTDPALLFCDEPTSGLDAYMAQTTVEVLARLAKRGKTVVLTIHQPSSEVYSLFDKILLMSEGRVAFLGSPAQAAEFFSRMGAPIPPKYNPADFYVQLLAIVPNEEVSCRARIHKVCDEFERSDLAAQNAAVTDFPAKGWPTMDPTAGGWWLLSSSGSGANGVTRSRTSRYKARWGAQFAALLWRSWLSVRKEPLLVRVRVLQTIMVSLLVGVMYFGQGLNQTGLGNLNAVLFTSITNLTFQNVLAVIKVFCSERAIIRREYMSAMYRVDAYFLARSTAELPIFCALPALYTFIVYFTVGLNPDPLRFFTCVAITCLIGLVASSFGYMISCAANNIATALSIGSPAVIPLLLYGGFFVNLDTIPKHFSWIQHLSWFRYGNEALLVNQWEGVDSISCSDAFSNSTCVRNGHVALQVYSFQEGSVWQDIGNMALLAVLFRIVAMIILVLRTHQGK